MKKLEELINSNEHFVECYSLMLPIKKQITQLAIAYAKICLEKAAEEAKVIKVHLWENVKDVDDEFECGDYEIKVFKKSITNIELP